MQAENSRRVEQAAAALAHHYLLRDRVLRRMLP